MRFFTNEESDNIYNEGGNIQLINQFGVITPALLTQKEAIEAFHFGGKLLSTTMYINLYKKNFGSIVGEDIIPVLLNNFLKFDVALCNINKGYKTFLSKPYVSFETRIFKEYKPAILKAIEEFKNT